MLSANASFDPAPARRGWLARAAGVAGSVALAAAGARMVVAVAGRLLRRWRPVRRMRAPEARLSLQRPPEGGWRAA